MDAPRTRAPLMAHSSLERSVDADIRAELDSHLELCAEELRSEGLNPEQAHALARERFGDFEETQRACRRQKLGGRFMLQKWNLVATAALLITVFFLGFRSRAQTQAMAVLNEELHTREAYLIERLHAAESSEALALEPVILQRGDSLEVRSTHHSDSLGVIEPLASDGTVLLPELGHVMVAGLTRTEIEELLNERYAVYYGQVDLHVKVHKGAAGRQ